MVMDDLLLDDNNCIVTARVSFGHISALRKPFLVCGRRLHLQCYYHNWLDRSREYGLPRHASLPSLSWPAYPHLSPSRATFSHLCEVACELFPSFRPGSCSEKASCGWQAKLQLSYFVSHCMYGSRRGRPLLELLNSLVIAIDISDPVCVSNSSLTAQPTYLPTILGGML